MRPEVYRTTMTTISSLNQTGRLLMQNGRPHYPALDAGLLVARAGLGSVLACFGIQKLAGGTEMWHGLGSALSHFGITFAPAFWGLCAALSEGIGGICLLAGLFFRPAAASLVFTMIVAATMQIRTSGFSDAAHAINVGFAVAGLLLTGPGYYSVDRILFWRNKVNS